MRAYRRALALFAILVPSFVPLVADHAPAGATAIPRLTVGDLSVAEGDAGKTTVRLPIDLDVPAPTKLVISFTVTGGTATPGVDFVAPKSGVRSGRVSIAAGKIEAFVAVAILGDTTTEPDDTVNIDVTSAPGTTVVRSRGTLTIQNDDVAASFGSVRAAGSMAPSAPRLAIGSPVVREGNAGIRHASVPVTLSVPAPAPVTVSFNTPGSTDDSSLDTCNDLTTTLTVGYVTKQITFLTGQQSKSVLVPVRGNMSPDPTLTVADSMSVVSGTATVAPASDIVVVDDDGGGDPPATPSPVGTYRVSEPAPGINPTFPSVVSDPTIGCGYPSSTFAAISADGRFVAFSSNADNLVGNDTNDYNDAFVKDTWTGGIERVSVAADGTQADGASFVDSISADGRFVLFSSDANNLVPGDDNGWRDTFLYDRYSGAIQRLGDIHTGNHGSSGGSISADDRYVAFTATVPLAGGCIDCSNIFVLDRTTNVISLVSTTAGGAGLGSAMDPAISGDGGHVAFVASDALGRTQTYVKDLDSGTLEAVSVNNAGQLGTGVFGTYPTAPALSYDGEVVAFNGQYCNMGLPSRVCGDGTDSYLNQIWVRDRVTQTTSIGSLSTDGTPISFDSDSPSLSSDGRYVLFETDDANFAPECTANGGKHVYERDLSSGTTQRIDVISATVPCPSDSWTLTNQAMSSDGSYVTFTTLVADTDVSRTNPEAVFVTRLR
jgi:hypothetical protein